uniref:Mitochondrial cytochrome c oxidase subunit VIc/VIIs domain-containing protein n=2 Tax=Timema TaxID=61471 RepID=A0A7R9IMH0_9NEOP|nr:unnamed protein product [Timema bartmani]CAD7461040.1 unnamed protein product [Timema tahoe]
MSKSFITEEKLRKPVMRHFIKSQARVHIAIALSVSAITGVLYKLLVCDPRKKRYADFYRRNQVCNRCDVLVSDYSNYDMEKEFERMRNAGVFQSAAPDEEEEEDDL